MSAPALLEGEPAAATASPSSCRASSRPTSHPRRAAGGGTTSGCSSPGAGTTVLVDAGFSDLPGFLEPGDLVVVNTSATIPAAIDAFAAGADGSSLRSPSTSRPSSPTTDG